MAWTSWPSGPLRRSLMSLAKLWSYWLNACPAPPRSMPSNA
ncbi:hypothetical protein ACFFX0_00880 [Citricoccus parietis]|uniref:Uncharacterized protein n=1 Tax=Citricoccus parietis TaxID=592307 RepID=A0ABV5FTN9_9MICC